MNDKGFLIGKLQKTNRVVTIELYKKGKLVGADQDGSRERVTVVAAIFVDSTKFRQLSSPKPCLVTCEAPGLTISSLLSIVATSPRHQMDG